MPHIVADRVRETTASTGTGPITPAGAVAGFRSFASVAASGDTVDIVIVHQTQPEWEVSTATRNADGTLTRTTVRSSSNSGAAVNFSAGAKNVFSTLPAGRLPAGNVVGESDTQTLTNKTISTGSTWSGNAIAVASGGTGATTLSSNAVLLGNGTSAVQVVAPGTSGNVLTSDGTTWVSQAASGGGGGLTNFTEGANTATPNATVPVNFVTAAGASTDIDIAIIPKGSGAVLRRIPNNATSGGNKRGANAVDLTYSSSDSADRVASGVGAIAMGANCRASGQNSIALGQFASAEGTRSVALGGGGNAGGSASSTASGSFAAGSNVSAGGVGAVVLGADNTAGANYSTIPGGRAATANSIIGLMAYGFNGDNVAVGRCQMSFFGSKADTTNATTTRATANFAAAAATNQLTLRNSSAFTFEGKVVARDTSTGDIKSWIFTGAIKRGANAAATALVGTPTVTVVAEDTAASTWAVALAADTTNGALAVNVTGQAAKTIRWTVVIHSAEVN